MQRIIRLELTPEIIYIDPAEISHFSYDISGNYGASIEIFFKHSNHKVCYFGSKDHATTMDNGTREQVLTIIKQIEEALI